MYSLPIDFNLSQFNGAVVQQICFATNIVSIVLDGSRYISFEGVFILSNASGMSKEFEVFPVENDFGILKLLEQKIKEIRANKSNNSLFISFENNVTLTLLASCNYESYTIKTDSVLLRV